MLQLGRLGEVGLGLPRLSLSQLLPLLLLRPLLSLLLPLLLLLLPLPLLLFLPLQLLLRLGLGLQVGHPRLGLRGLVQMGRLGLGLPLIPRLQLLPPLLVLPLLPPLLPLLPLRLLCARHSESDT